MNLLGVVVVQNRWGLVVRSPATLALYKYITTLYINTVHLLHTNAPVSG